jgi:hypothetical protein
MPDGKPSGRHPGGLLVADVVTGCVRTQTQPLMQSSAKLTALEQQLGTTFA